MLSYIEDFYRNLIVKHVCFTGLYLLVHVYD